MAYSPLTFSPCSYLCDVRVCVWMDSRNGMSDQLTHTHTHTKEEEEIPNIPLTKEADTDIDLEPQWIEPSAKEINRSKATIRTHNISVRANLIQMCCFCRAGTAPLVSKPRRNVGLPLFITSEEDVLYFCPGGGWKSVFHKWECILISALKERRRGVVKGFLVLKRLLNQMLLCTLISTLNCWYVVIYKLRILCRLSVFVFVVRRKTDPRPALRSSLNWSKSLCCHYVATSWVFLAVAVKYKNSYFSCLLA